MGKIKKRIIFLLIFVLLLVKSFIGSEQEAFLKNKKEFTTFSDKDWRNCDINSLLDNVEGSYYCAEKKNLFLRYIVIIGKLNQNFDLKQLFNACDRAEWDYFYFPPFINLSKLKDVTKQLGISDINHDRYGYYFVPHTVKSNPHYRKTMIFIRGTLENDGWSFELYITEEREFCLWLDFR